MRLMRPTSLVLILFAVFSLLVSLDPTKGTALAHIANVREFRKAVRVRDDECRVGCSGTAWKFPYDIS